MASQGDFVDHASDNSSSWLVVGWAAGIFSSKPAAEPAKRVHALPCWLLLCLLTACTVCPEGLVPKKGRKAGQTVQMAFLPEPGSVDVESYT